MLSAFCCVLSVVGGLGFVVYGVLCFVAWCVLLVCLSFVLTVVCRFCLFRAGRCLQCLFGGVCLSFVVCCLAFGV